MPTPYRHPAGRSCAGLVAATLAVAGGITFLGASAASATSCSTPVLKYASSNNTISLLSGVSTFDSMVAACPGIPLAQTSPGVWNLNANLTLLNGSELDLKGSARGGDVNTLRMESNADNAPTDVVALIANYGTIHIDGVTITSWDTVSGVPDTDPYLPAGAPAGSRARAYIRASSFLDASNVARESTMTFNKADVSNLGWYNAESYGVSYKGEGCDSAHLSVCASLHVYGSQTYSHFHSLWMGTYTFDSLNMSFLHNTYDHNIMYGLDQHDDSDNEVVSYNHFAWNGDHGYICSQRCTGLKITHNESDHNGVNPYTGPTPSGDTSNGTQFHGFMLHRGSDNDLIQLNNAHDNTGAGIAIFDSTGDKLASNTLTNNLYGLRYSVGSTTVNANGNTISGSTGADVYTFVGTDTPSYSNPSGRVLNAYFKGNSFAGALKFTGEDGAKFSELSGSVKFSIDSSSSVKFYSASVATYTAVFGSTHVYTMAAGKTLTLTSAQIGAGVGTVTHS